MKNKKILFAKGQGLVEYGLILALISVISVGTLTVTGTKVRDVYCNISGVISESQNCSSHYFFDDFDGDLSNWDVIKGNWEIVDGKLQNTTHGQGQIFTDINESDYEVVLGGVTLSQGKGFGVIFKAEDTEAFNGYTFQYDPGYGQGEFIFRKWANGHEFSPFARAKAPDFDWYNTEHDVKVVVNGGQYTAYVDDQIVCQGVDETWTENEKAVGLRTWSNSEITVDSFTVNPIETE